MRISTAAFSLPLWVLLVIEVHVLCGIRRQRSLNNKFGKHGDTQLQEEGLQLGHLAELELAENMSVQFRSCVTDPFSCALRLLPKRMQGMIASGQQMLFHPVKSGDAWWSSSPQFYKQHSKEKRYKVNFAGDLITILDFEGNKKALRDLVNRPSGGKAGELQVEGVRLAGRVSRKNELGNFDLHKSNIFYDKFANSIVLGAPDEVHDLLRPHMDWIYGTKLSEFEGTSDVGFSGKGDGRHWSDGELYESAKDFLTKADTLNYTTQYCQWALEQFHKSIGLDDEILRASKTNISSLSEYATTICKMQSAYLAISLVPPVVGRLVGRHVGLGMSMTEIKTWREQVQEDYGKALSKRGLVAKDTQTLEIIAAGVLEAHLFAGGLSVPSVIASCVAHLYKNGGKDSLFNMSSEGKQGKLGVDFALTDYVWEVLRVMSPVSHVPMWYDNEGGSWWQKWRSDYKPRKVLLCTSCAQYDPSIWKSSSDMPATDFAIRNRDDYERYSLGWADAAHNPTNPERDRWCPGKRFSLALIVAWMKAFTEVMDEWQLHLPDGSFKASPMSPFVAWFDLTKDKARQES